MTNLPNKRVLSVDPMTRGFAFVVLEGPNTLLDWGTKTTIQHKNQECLLKVHDLVKQYAPDCIVFEDHRHWSSRRCPRIRLLLEEISKLAKEMKVELFALTPSDVKKFWSHLGANNKQAIALTL